VLALPRASTTQGVAVSPSSTTILASGHVNGADQLSIELIEPLELPPTILIRWPQKPTPTTPAGLDATVAAAMRVLSNAVIELAAIRVRKRL
jgi:hypothetical protein